MNDQASLEKLREFVGGRDRDETPIFSGRAEELGAVREDLERSMRKWFDGKSAWKSATWVFQGAPGAGKSALLEHLKETLPRDYADINLQVVQLQTASSVDDWKEQLANGLSTGAGDDLRAQKQAAAGVAWAVVSAARTRTGPVLTWESLKLKISEGEIRPRPVLLIIDEVQKVKGGRGVPEEKQQGEFLNALHENSGNLPVFPVYGGLAWSLAGIKAAGGPSRFTKGRVRTLSPLSKDECGEALGKFVAEFAVDADEAAIAEWTETLAEESQGWPQHLHTHLQAIGGVLLDNGRSLDVIAPEERAAIAAEAKEARDEYYAGLLDSDELLDLSCLAAAGASLVARSGHPMQVGDLGDEIDAISGQADTGRLRLPPGATGKDFAQAMIRAGLLHKAPGRGGTLSVPIPSMPGYLLQTYGMEEPEISGGKHSKTISAPAP